MKRVVFALIPLLLVVVITEATARQFDRNDAREQARIALDFDADLMWGLSSQVPGPDFLPNADGLRGPPLTEKPAGTLRILTLGDSSVYGDFVHYPEVFSTALAAMLNAVPGPRVEPVVGGVPGYSSVQAMGVYERVREKVAADIVVIGCMWSDAFAMAQTDREWKEQLAASYAPWRPVTDALTMLSRHSAAARLLRRAVHDLLLPASDGSIHIGWLDFEAGVGVAGSEHPGRPSVDPDGERVAAPTPGGPGAPPKPRAPPAPDKDGKFPTPAGTFSLDRLVPLPERVSGPYMLAQTTRVPLDEYVANLGALVARAREDGALPVFLLLPHPYDDVGRTLPAVAGSYRDAMRDTAARLGVPLVDGERWFVAHPCGGCPRFSDSIHPNPAGHRVIAEAVLAVVLGDPDLRARLGR